MSGLVPMSRTGHAKLQEEVKALAFAVATTADAEEDALVRDYGGMTAIDKIKSNA